MENSIENKIAFMAQYYGQYVLRSYFPEQTGLSKIDGMCFHIQHLLMNGYLELKRLPDLTDKDALNIAGILKWNHYTDEGKIKQVKNFIDSYLDYHSTNISPNEYFEVLDYLRSNAYAVPYNGMTVEQQVEYLWVKIN